MRFLLMSAALLLASCAGNGGTETVASAPPPTQAAAPIAPPPSAQPSAAATGIQLPPEPAPPAPRDGDIVVRGGRETPVQSPNADPRTPDERMADIHRWDQCVMRLQASAEDNPTRPQLTSPEELCARRLGMASRDAVPDARR